jgi:hypothetical protein
MENYSPLPEALEPCPLCNLVMHEFEDGNFGHDTEYAKGIVSTCPLRGQLFDNSERRAWNVRPQFLNAELVVMLESVIGLGRKDTTNPKYDETYLTAKQLLAKCGKGEK